MNNPREFYINYRFVYFNRTRLYGVNLSWVKIDRMVAQKYKPQDVDAMTTPKYWQWHHIRSIRRGIIFG